MVEPKPLIDFVAVDAPWPLKIIDLVLEML